MGFSPQTDPIQELTIAQLLSVSKTFTVLKGAIKLLISTAPLLAVTITVSQLGSVIPLITISSFLVQIIKQVKQLEKQVDVIRAYYHRNDEIFTQEIAMYKLAVGNLYETDCQAVIKENRGSIAGVEKKFFVVEKTGTYAETKKLYDDLQPYGLMQFVRSGRIAITKPKMLISELIR